MQVPGIVKKLTARAETLADQRNHAGKDSNEYVFGVFLVVAHR